MYSVFYPSILKSLNGWVDSVSVVITGLGADFTRMESIGKVDASGEASCRSIFWGYYAD
jgi:hypothetical protein